MNALQEMQNYYDLLEVSTDATPQEIREAYVRMKNAYSKDSPAIYTLMSVEDTENLLKRLEEAYNVLSNEDKRKSYDEHHGYLSQPESMVRNTPSPLRVPERIVESKTPGFLDSAEGLMEAPSTDFGSTPQPQTTRETPSNPFADAVEQTAGRDDLKETIRLRVEDEQEWHGDTIREIREMKGVSIDDLSHETKISKRYLRAIEGDEYDTLPVKVYLRGFLIQICRQLKLPSDRVVHGYLSRYKRPQPEED